MPEIFTKMFKSLSDFWKGLDKSQKTRIYITAALVAIFVGVGLFLIARPSYTTVIQDASDQDIAEMQKILTEKGISYQLTDDKKGIIVDVKDSDQAHFELVSAGYPKNGLTFADALSNIKINTTESDKKHIWQQLDESDIARQLKLFKNVKDASVTITKPEKTLFIDDTNPSDVKAAVTIIPNGEITLALAQSIVKTVASSVEGLDPKNVTVVDEAGNILNSESTDTAIEKTSTQYEMKQRVKNDLEKNVRSILNGRFDSFDSASVVVNPILDFDTLTQQSKEISNPNGMETGAIVSRQEEKEEVKNGDTGAVAGMESNPGTTPSYPMGSTDAGSYKRSDVTENWAYNESNKQVEKSIGEVIPEKTTAAITLLYGNRIADDSKLTDELIAQVKDLVSKATGIPFANVSVTKLKVVPPETVTPSTSETIMALIDQYGLLALLFIMFVVLLIIAFPRKKKEKLVPALAVSGVEFENKYNIPEIKHESLPEIDIEERSEVKKQLEKFVKQKPDAVAQLLRNWLTDDFE